MMRSQLPQRLPSTPKSAQSVQSHQQQNQPNMPAMAQTRQQISQKPPPAPPTAQQLFPAKLATLNTANSSSGGKLTSGQQTSASSSRMLQDYAISQELAAKLEECLENKYGGRARAHSAASRIQRFYRHYKLRQRFQRITNGGGTALRNGQARESREEGQNQANKSPSKRTLATTVFCSSIGATPASTASTRHAPHRFQPGQGSPSPIRYQPTTSLSSQLRAERQLHQQQLHGREINLNALESTDGTSPAFSMRQPQTTGHSMRAQPQQQQRVERNPFMDTPATPRLCQRRIQIPSNSTVFSAYGQHQPVTHFHPELYSAGPAAAMARANNGIGLGGQGENGTTTVLVVDGPVNGEEKEEKHGQKGGDEEENTKSGYHRSQSPAMLSGTGLHVVQLQSRPAGTGIGGTNRSQNQSPSSSPMRHPQPPPSMGAMADNSKQFASSQSQQQQPNGQRSVWVPRQFVTGSSPTMHQQQIQQRQLTALQQQQQQHLQHYSSSSSSGISSASNLMLMNNTSGNSNNISGMSNGGGSGGNGTATAYSVHQQQYHHQHYQLQQQQQQQQFHHRTPVVNRSHSSAASYAYQTGSLPRMVQQQQQQNTPKKQPNGGPICATVNDLLGGIRSTCTYVGALDLQALREREVHQSLAHHQGHLPTL